MGLLKNYSFQGPGLVLNKGEGQSNGTCGKIKTSDTASQAAIDSLAERCERC